MATLQEKIAASRRRAAAFAWNMHNKHPLGSPARDSYLRDHGAWIRAAQLAEAGDLRPVSVSPSGELTFLPTRP